VPARSPATRCWTLVTSSGALDVAISARDDERLGAVLPRLAAALRLPSAELWSGSTRLAPELPLTDPALLHGALLGLGRPGPRPGAAAGSSALELHVVGRRDGAAAGPRPARRRPR
jgi:DNA segregation ATPase FtsK/SpoIIIE, S-DNA-T family